MAKPRRERIIIDIKSRGDDDDEILTLSTTGGLSVGDTIQYLERAKIKFIFDNTISKEERDVTKGK